MNALLQQQIQFNPWLLQVEVERLEAENQALKAEQATYVSDLHHELTVRERELDEYRAEIIAADRRIADLMDEYGYLCDRISILLTRHKAVLKEKAAKQHYIADILRRLRAPLSDSSLKPAVAA